MPLDAKMLSSSFYYVGFHSPFWYCKSCFCSKWSIPCSDYSVIPIRIALAHPAQIVVVILVCRGRAYPIPPHLNHLGADVSRGILQFAESLPLGQDGLGWLLTQVANLFGGGADKLPMPDRKIFGEQHLDDILDSAEKPLDGKKWWMGADEPWQLLATCKEIRNALNWGSVETFPSRMHVHQVSHKVHLYLHLLELFLGVGITYPRSFVQSAAAAHVAIRYAARALSVFFIKVVRERCLCQRICMQGFVFPVHMGFKIEILSLTIFLSNTGWILQWPSTLRSSGT